MGCSLSSNSVKSPKAKVVTVDGSLKEFLIPVTAVDALGTHRSTFFMCNSDRLFFDSPIPALALEDELEAGQIYFVLPMSMLGCPLSGADMAGLASKAGRALDAAAKKCGRSRRIRVVPVAEFVKPEKNARSSRSASIRSSMAYGRKNRVSLSTIEENDV